MYSEIERSKRIYLAMARSGIERMSDQGSRLQLMQDVLEQLVLEKVVHSFKAPSENNGRAVVEHSGMESPSVYILMYVNLNALNPESADVMEVMHS